MIPSHLICDSLPSLEKEVGATFILRTIRPASLWRFPDNDEDNGVCVKIFEPISENVSALEMARIAREVGEFWNQYRDEEESC